tara:strand:- start:156 stop:695 length:540 start_codon:yes stop_codon:yes gene_type:complete
MLQDGVGTFTIDLLSQRLRMSKKTIYSLFPSKEDLLDEITDFLIMQLNDGLTQLKKKEKNPAKQFINTMEFIVKAAHRIPPQRVGEVKLKYPHFWKKFEWFEKEQNKEFKKMLDDAQLQGYIRPELDTKSIAELYIGIVTATFQPDFFVENETSVPDTIRLFVDLITGGLFTKEGMKYV